MKSANPQKSSVPAGAATHRIDWSSQFAMYMARSQTKATSFPFGLMRGSTTEPGVGSMRTVADVAVRSATYIVPETAKTARVHELSML